MIKYNKVSSVKKRIMKILSFMLILIIVVSNYTIVNADSGFDTSYSSSSGSYSSSSSSSSSSSNWSRGNYSSNRNYNYSNGTENLYLITYFIIGLAYLINCLSLTTKKEKKLEKEIPNFNLNTFLKERYSDYVIIQKAWSNFDYDTLRTKLTDELYNQYVMQLDTLKLKNQKNIMTYFRYINSDITKVINNKNEIIVELSLVTEFIDYIEQDNKVIRGNDKERILVYYKLTFICDKTNDTIEECPNCGAPTQKNSSQICPYCKTIIKMKSACWRLSKKSVISQK